MTIDRTKNKPLRLENSPEVRDALRAEILAHHMEQQRLTEELADLCAKADMVAGDVRRFEAAEMAEAMGAPGLPDPNDARRHFVKELWDAVDAEIKKGWKR